MSDRTPDLCSTCGLPHEGLIGYNHPFGRRTSNQRALPTWEECEQRVGDGSATPLERFIYHNEPADVDGADFAGADEFRRQLSAVLADIGPSPSETSGGWQPIETAPKSKSDAGRDRQYVLVVYPGWRDGKPDPFVLMAYQDDLGWDTGTWRLHEEPTHWMPLPAPPSSSEKASELRELHDRRAAEKGWPTSENGGADSHD